ncbi:protein FAM24A [Lepus europaeus]|uniref:protein FAM24A n=1 Tax=Lepus europaeus TaxID=9983 RepID=UPI002B49275A|nr:protein FAM24A [Lepus europaeus]
MFDLKTKVMIGIGSSLLLAAVVLIGVVIGLYIKVSNALKAAKEPPVCGTKHTAKVFPGKTNPMDSCRALPCCDDSSVYTDFDPLPPCSCATNEGL